jgi:magnesium chelatase family protein
MKQILRDSRIHVLAWTLADLDGRNSPNADHIGRALYLRKATTT